MEYFNIENDTDVLSGLNTLQASSNKAQLTFDYTYNIFTKLDTLIGLFVKHTQSKHQTSHTDDFTHIYNDCINKTTNAKETRDNNIIWKVKHNHMFIDIHDIISLKAFINIIYNELFQADHLYRWIFLRDEEYNILVKMGPYFLLFNGYRDNVIMTDIESIIRYLFSIDINRTTGCIDTLLYKLNQTHELLVNKYCYDILFVAFKNNSWDRQFMKDEPINKPNNKETNKPIERKPSKCKLLDKLFKLM